MKVLKFGGTSVGTPASIRNVKSIVEAIDGPAVVVVSALGGITDKLILTSKMAEAGDADYEKQFAEIKQRHIDMIEEVIADPQKKSDLREKVDVLLNKLETIYRGVFLLGDLSERTYDEIVSFGERISSHIAATLIDGAMRFDSLGFIKTTEDSVIDVEATNTLIKKELGDFASKCKVALVPGFISTDTVTGKTTNLGRGGSDYTASLIAANLDAEILEIWTDVDGFMTADPRIIKKARVIDELSYADAMELCNFGAKVVYPPTLYPVFTKGIPILIKNTFNPTAPGTIIKKDVKANDSALTGITSINDTCLINISSPTMLGIPGIDSRIFGSLSEHNISVFLACQSSSETGITIGLRMKDAEKACEVLNHAFEAEISMGAMSPVKVQSDLATVSVVGENMKNYIGTSAQLFNCLNKNGISAIACAQGASESNISIVVEKALVNKALNALYNTFFLNECQELNVFVCGVGTVGSKLLEQINSQSEYLLEEKDLRINIAGIARSTKAIFDHSGLVIDGYRERLQTEGMDITPEILCEKVIGMKLYGSVFVDCTPSAEIADIYEKLLSHGISVVAANKMAASSEYKHYKKLKSLARKNGCRFCYETNVGAGLPIIGTMSDLKNSGDKIEKIEAVLSGTLNYICSTISKEIPFSQTVRLAKEHGYSETDPRTDLSGKDVMRKLLILSRETGNKLEQSDIKAAPVIPDELFACSLDEFWEKLPEQDAKFEALREKAEKENKRLRYVARMENGQYTVGLETVSAEHPAYELEGANNIVLLTTSRYHDDPLVIKGYGAGADVTAAGVFADILGIANIK